MSTRPADRNFASKLRWPRLLRRRLPPTQPSGPPRKSINLALQGGGAHGAFTWGVLDRLLADGRLTIEGISGASAGAVNAAILADGLTRGGPATARERLAAFWRAASSDGNLTDLQRHVVGRLFPTFPFDGTPITAWFDAWARTWAPPEINPLNINPLKELIERFVDFEALRASKRELFVAATNVSTGATRIFTRAELSAEAVMASACLPLLFSAVEIDGVSYWDGGYAANPPLTPFLQATGTEDLLIVQIDPVERRAVPVTRTEIINRVNEINFNATMLSELRALDFAGRMIDEQRLPRGFGNGEYRRPRLHRIALEDPGDRFAGTKLNTSFEFFSRLHELGAAAAQRFMDAHFEDIGARATLETTLDARPDTTRDASPDAAVALDAETTAA